MTGLASVRQLWTRATSWERCGASTSKLGTLKLFAHVADSDVCYTDPLDGYECVLVMPANGGEKFALVFVLLVSAITLIWVNGL